MRLVLSNVDVVYAGVIQVLRSASLTVPDGQMVVLLGSNGAGKTTTLKAISGLLHSDLGAVTSGSIAFDGVDITNGDPTGIFRQGVVQVLEGRKVLEHLTVEQNLMVGAHLRSDKTAVKSDLQKVFHYFPRLPDLLKRTAGYLSGGEMQMVLIGRALMARPKLLILDEPSMGLAPILVQQLFEIIGRIKRDEGLTILLVEQNARAALSISKRAVVLNLGKVVVEGPASDIAADEELRHHYLGF